MMMTLGSRTRLSYTPAAINASPKSTLTPPQMLFAARIAPPINRFSTPHTMLEVPLELSFLSNKQKDPANASRSTRCGSLVIHHIIQEEDAIARQADCRLRWTGPMMKREMASRLEHRA